MTEPSAQLHDSGWPTFDPVRTGLKGRCPRCSEGRLFNGFLTLRECCDVCGLSYAFADPADGPAFFVICFACVPAVVFAIIIQLSFDPPFWIHVLITLPVVSAACILPLRPLKGWLVCSQYVFEAGEGEIAFPFKTNNLTNEMVVPPVFSDKNSPS